MFVEVYKRGQLLVQHPLVAAGAHPQTVVGPELNLVVHISYLKRIAIGKGGHLLYRCKPHFAPRPCRTITSRKPKHRPNYRAVAFCP